MNRAIELADVERPFALFAQGISGRPYRIQPETAFDGGADRLPGAALHDPSTLYLPDAFGLYAERAANVGGLRLVALHQLGYAEFGSHAFAIDAARARCPALARLPRPETGPRASDLTMLFGHFAVPALARELFRIIEAMRIDHTMLRRYPGIRPHYRRFATREQRRRHAALVHDLGTLLDALILHGLGTPGPELTERDVTGVLAPLLEQVAAVTRDRADVYASSTALTSCYPLLQPWLEAAASEPTFEPPERPVIHGDPPLEWLQRQFRVEHWEATLEELASSAGDAEELGELAPASSEEPAGAVAPLLPEDATVDMPSAAGTTAGGASRPAGLAAGPAAQDDALDAIKRRIDMERASLRAALGPPGHASPSFLYDEWDEPAQRYRRAWCRLFEIPIDTLGVSPRALSKEATPLRESVRRRFEQLRPQAYSPTRKVLDGDELDWDQLIAYRVDRHHTATPDERVYQRRDRTSRDVSALFLVDLSASTDDTVEPRHADPVTAENSSGATPNLRDPDDDDPFGWSQDPVPAEPLARRRIIDVQRDALLLMADALDRLGDRFGVFGFSGYGRDCVEFYVAKDFRTPWDARALKALSAMEPRRSTRMGPAIRHGVRLLTRAGGALKVLIVLSDGFPQDCDYGPDRGSHDYGVADTAQALREAGRAGIETFCITVDRSGHDYLKRMCDERRYLVIDEIETLPEALSQVYEALTG